MATLIQERRDTAANWTSVNPILAQGQVGVELGTGRWKVGDGETPWITLAYMGTLASTGTAGAPTAGQWDTDMVAIDSAGRLWVCTAAGTPGTWVLPSESLVGALLGANNLSDVADAGTSRFNLANPALSAVAAAATANVNIASPGATADGYPFQANDEVLLAGQTTTSQNGVWTWNGAAVPLTRPREFPSGGLVKRGRTVMVANGTLYANTQWSLPATAAGLTIDTTAQVWKMVGIGTWVPTADALDLGRMAALGSSDRLRSFTLADANYNDSAATLFIENWAAGDITANWAGAASAVQISSNRMYSNGQGGSAGINHGYAPSGGPTGVKLRAVFNVRQIIAGGASGAVILGVSSDAVGVSPAAGGTNAVGLEFSSTGILTFTKGTAVALATLATGTYNWVVTVTVDANYISVVAVDSDGSLEYRFQYPVSGFAVNNLFLFNNDSRLLSGASVGLMGARKDFGTLVPATGLETVNRTVQWTEVSSNNVKVTLPTNYDTRKPAPVILACHSSANNENLFSDNTNELQALQAFVAAGFIVVSTAVAADTDEWGNPAIQAAIYAAYQYVRDNYSIGPVCLYAVSMGSLAALNTLAARLIPGIAALVLVSPVANLADVYSPQPGFTAFASLINTAYNIPGGGTYAAQTAGCDPALKSANAFRGVPTHIYYATDDTTVDQANNALLLQTILGTYPTELDVTPNTGLGGHSFNIATFTASMVAFFQKYTVA